MLLLREIFEKKFFDDEIDIELKRQYESFLKTSNEMKWRNYWDEFEKHGEQFYKSLNARLFVFLSHSHRTLNYTMGLISFLRKHYNVFIYIDSEDPHLPPETSILTAKAIKKSINRCDRFLFLASNGAVESNWCNWELGIGDVVRFSPDIYKNRLAFIAWHDSSVSHGDYKGHEYMEMYPFIVHYGEDKLFHSLDDAEKNVNEYRYVEDRNRLHKKNYFNEEPTMRKKYYFNPKNFFSDSRDVPDKTGWFVRYKENGIITYVPLDKWFSSDFSLE